MAGYGIWLYQFLIIAYLFTSYLTYVVDESPKAYFQSSSWQVSLPPQHPVLATTARKSTQLSDIHPELDASWKLSPSRDRSDRRTEIQPANHCATELTIVWQTDRRTNRLTDDHDKSNFSQP